MRISGCAGVWLGLVLVSCGLMVASAQTVPTTNEVRAMRGLGPIEGSGVGPGLKVAIEETSALVG
jgi:hypothetical protein